MKQQFPVDVRFQLIDTLCAVFYWKSRLIGFLSSMDIPRSLFEETRMILTSQTKRVALDHLIDDLLELPDSQGLGPINRMLQKLTRWSNFSSANDIAEAQRAVKDLAGLVETHNSKQRQLQDERERRKQQTQSQSERAKLEAQQQSLLERYFALVQSTNPQKRGRSLESLLHDLFEFEDLNPEQAFALKGEQIDGAFELDSTHYLVEAKWEKEKVGPKDVSWFREKVERRLKGTRGLMISIEGFTEGSIDTARDSKCVILMDGDDLYHVLDPRIDLSLKELLHHKITCFSRFENPFVTARDFIRKSN